MPRSLPANVILEKNKIETPHPWLVLLTIELNDTDSTVFRLANNTEDVEFRGHTFQRFPFEIEVQKFSTSGEIPTVTIRVSNVTKLLQPYIEEHEGGIGSTVTVTVVNAAWLNSDFSELEMQYSVMACSSDANAVEFILGAPSPLRQRCPLYRYMAMHCRWQYGSVECGHTGGTCNRTLNNCRDNNNAARFGGFVGIKSGGLKIVS